MKQRADGRWVKTKNFNGKRITFYSKAKTERAAIRDIENQMMKYAEKITRTKKFAEIAEAWKEEHIENVSYKTWQGYNAHYNRALYEFGDYLISEIDVPDVQNYINRLGKQQYSQKTVKSALSVISLIFDQAIIEKQIAINPCKFVKIPQGLSKKERELPSNEEIEKVLNGVNCHFGEFAYLILHTGLRRGEALALHSDNIDFEKKIIKVCQSVYFKSNQAEIKPPKTQSGYRSVYLLDCLIPILKDKEGYIFGKTKPMSEQAFKRAWERYCRESGVTITPHQLRHGYATILYDNEIGPKTAQKLLGHSDYKTTFEIYTHISESKNKEDFEKLNAWSKSSQTTKKS